MNSTIKLKKKIKFTFTIELKNMDKDKIFVVGIGASAGGLDAIQQLFSELDNNTGMAFVIIQHLSPDFKSLMPELLSKYTKMKIYTAKDKQIIKPNCIYLNQNNKNLHIKGNKLYLLDKGPKTNLNLPIDIFFHTLGEEQKEHSIGVILSGTGSDGSRGIQTIKEKGGTIFVQNPDEAQFDGMPNSSINTNLVDFILNAKDIASALLKTHLPAKILIPEKELNENNDESLFLRILEEIKVSTGINFAEYKNNTLLRRLEKRIRLNNFISLVDYYKFFVKNEKEKNTLKQDFLIGVTTFFRDKKSFEYLKENVIPELCNKKTDNKPIRVWVPGCSTGEEVYSIAILLDDYLRKTQKSTDFKIFATDVDDVALKTASQGSFHINIANEIEKEYLDRYFIKNTGRYHISKRLREKIVFSNHNLLKDPPFIRIDLISCRNLLIYLTNMSQQRVLLSFQFSLNRLGYLFLGSSESLGHSSKYFKIISVKHKIWQNITETKVPPSRGLENHHIRKKTDDTVYLNENNKKIQNSTSRAESIFFEYLSKRHSPVSIFVDSNFEILFIRGNISKRLSFSEGIFQNNLLKVVSPEIKTIIKNGIRKLNTEKKDVIIKNVLNLKSKKNEAFDISFHLTESILNERDVYLIQFSEDKKLDNKEEEVIIDNYSKLQEISRARIEDIENELSETKLELQNAIEELETSNEELQSSNEELMASNEELQSTNEELQSVNEELYTVNSEFEDKNHELISLNNDITNLLDSTEVGTLFLDKSLLIRKFTPKLSELFNLQSNDIGRPIMNFSSSFDEPNRMFILKTCSECLQNLKNSNEELKDINEKYYNFKVKPFITEDKKIEGVIITFIDITDLKQTEIELLKNNKIMESAQDLIKIATWEWDIESDKILRHNNAWEEIFEFNKNDKISKQWEKCLHEEDKEHTVSQLNNYISGKTNIYNSVARFKTSRTNKTYWLSNTGKISEYDKNGKPIRMIGASIDVTESKNNEILLKQQNEFAEKITNNTSNGIYVYNIIEGKNTFMNKKYEELLGYNIEEINNMKPDEFFNLFHKDDQENISNHMDIVTKDLKSDKIEYRFRHKKGHWVWCFSNDAPFEIDENGKLISFIGIFSDITEDKKNREIISRNKELENISYLISNDLKQPINSIIDLSQSLKEYETKLDNVEKNNLEIVFNSANKIKSYVNGLIEYSTITKLNITENIVEEVDITKIIDDVKIDINNSITSNNAKISYDNKIKKINASKKNLFTLFKKLILNAINHTYQNKIPNIKITSKKLKTSYQFSIKDNGLGIDENNLENVFDIFTQNNDSNQTNGFGLAICKKIVELEGGEIWIESELENGSTVYFTIALK